MNANTPQISRGPARSASECRATRAAILSRFANQSWRGPIRLSVAAATSWTLTRSSSPSTPRAGMFTTSFAGAVPSRSAFVPYPCRTVDPLSPARLSAVLTPPIVAAIGGGLSAPSSPRGPPKRAFVRSNRNAEPNGVFMAAVSPGRPRALTGPSERARAHPHHPPNGAPSIQPTWLLQPTRSVRQAEALPAPTTARRESPDPGKILRLSTSKLASFAQPPKRRWRHGGPRQEASGLQASARGGLENHRRARPGGILNYGQSQTTRPSHRFAPGISSCERTRIIQPTL